MAPSGRVHPEGPGTGLHPGVGWGGTQGQGASKGARASDRFRGWGVAAPRGRSRSRGKGGRLLRGKIHELRQGEEKGQPLGTEI